MRYVGLMLGIPIVGTIAYIVHVVRPSRRDDVPRNDPPPTDAGPHDAQRPLAGPPA